MSDKQIWLIFLLIMVISCLIGIVIYLNLGWIFRYGVITQLKKIEYGRITIVDASKNAVIADITGSQAKDLHVTIHVIDTEMFFKRLATDGDVGLGETYTEGVWDCNSLISLMNILVMNADFLVPKQNTYNVQVVSFNYDKEVVQHHYDVGNDFYESFLLDDMMAYSCGLFFCPKDTLNDAQYNKVHTIMRKLNINAENLDILDIGCGWGGIPAYMHKMTNSNMYGLTISKEQVDFITENVSTVRPIFGHYKDIQKEGIMFDRIYSIGLFEHVRCSNYDTFFASVKSVMKPGARFLLHTISTNRDDTLCSTGSTVIFTTKHIFPGGQIPKIEWVLAAAARNGLQLVHLETFGGHHYAKTLRAWRENMLKSKDKILGMGYGIKHIKAYEYYFAQCEAAFINNQMQLSQYVFDNTLDNSHVYEHDVFGRCS